MTDSTQHDTPHFQEQANIRHEIEKKITRLFAPEDLVLQQCLAAAKEAGLPAIQNLTSSGQVPPIPGGSVQCSENSGNRVSGRV